MRKINPAFTFPHYAPKVEFSVGLHTCLGLPNGKLFMNYVQYVLRAPFISFFFILSF